MNEFIDYWDNLYLKKSYFGTGPTKLAKLAEQFFQRVKKHNILEIGCGQGRDAIFFSQLGHNVKAFDISSNAVEFVNATKSALNLTNLDVIVHDVQKPFPFGTELFDFVYSNLALQFFELQNLKKILKNISKSMQNNSFFLLSTKKEGDKYYKTGKKIADFAYQNQGITRYFYDDITLKEILSKEFQIIRFEEDQHTNLDSTVSVWWKILIKNIK